MARERTAGIRLPVKSAGRITDRQMRKHGADGADKWRYFLLRKQAGIIVCGWMGDKSRGDVNKFLLYFQRVSPGDIAFR